MLVCLILGWWNWHTHYSQKIAPQGIRVRLPNPRQGILNFKL
nr:MAG TPA: hypothetical protein [Herelleviridae sp.]